MKNKISLLMLLITAHLYAATDGQANDGESSLLDLPSDVLCGIYYEQLNFEEKAKLHTACVASSINPENPKPKSSASIQNHAFLEEARKLPNALNDSEYLLNPTGEAHPKGTIEVPSTITDAYLLSFLTKQSNIKSLSLRNCPNLTHASIINAIQLNPELRYLDLSRCRQLTNEALIVIASHCPDLISLNLAECWGITNTGLIAIASSLKNLRSLNLTWCHRIIDKGLIAIATHCPNLTSLDITMCKEITGEGLMIIAKKCPNLTVLKLGFLGITDTELIAMASYLRNLTSLDITMCRGITGEGLMIIAENCPNLTVLKLGFLGITDTDLIAIARISGT